MSAVEHTAERTEAHTEKRKYLLHEISRADAAVGQVLDANVAEVRDPVAYRDQFNEARRLRAWAIARLQALESA